MNDRQMIPTHKVTVEISTSILYPWEIGNYFKHNGRKYRIEKIIDETKYCKENGIISEIAKNTPIENQRITSRVVGALVE
jgi:hypothetical protein